MTIGRSALLATAFTLATVPAALAAPVSTLEAQDGLVWSGLYDGQINGRDWPGPAVRRFQRQQGAPATGVLTDAQAQLLSQRAEAAKRRVGYSPYFDAAAGVRIGLPQAFAARMDKTSTGTRFYSPDDRVQIEIDRFPGVTSWAQFLEAAKTNWKGLRVTYSAQGKDWLVVSGFVGERQFYTRLRRDSDGLRGFAVAYDSSVERVVEPVIVAMSSDFARPDLLAGR